MLYEWWRLKMYLDCTEQLNKYQSGDPSENPVEFIQQSYIGFIGR